MELKRWLEGSAEKITHRWHSEVRIREDRRGDSGDGFLKSVLDHLVSFIPHCLGEQRETGEEIWQQAAHLYGSLALQRGLAAGEVVEEFHLLRDAVFGLLFEVEGGRMSEAGFSRDILTLNRIIDAGVVQASVAYVDDLFFSHLQGSGVPEGVTDDLVEEIRSQLVTFQLDLQDMSLPREDR